MVSRLQHIRTVARDPALFMRKLIKHAKLWEGRTRLQPRAENFLKRRDEWDVLVILDGCRYDTFVEETSFDAPVEAVISPGSCTPEWARATITEQYPDIVYLSGNPFVSRQFLEQWGNPDPFHHLEPLWDSGWDETLRTVTPQTMVEAGTAFMEHFSDKKVVLHCMQPHHPFIGETRIEEAGMQHTEEARRDPAHAHVYDLLHEGVLEEALVRRAYRENLQLIMPYLELLVGRFPEKRFVLTADHGNCFGAYDVYGHPEAMPVRELIQVPWQRV